MVKTDYPCHCGENNWEPYKVALVLPEYELSDGEFKIKSMGMPVNAYTCEKCHSVRFIHIKK